ncbi:MAG: DUF1501 domain-containing protein [Chitinophagaceae bacterium]
MQRRKFIRNSAATAAVSLPVLNGLSMKAMAEGSWLHELYTSTVQTDHVLVVIQLSGGNDGLNTVIPLDQYSNYSNARSNIAVAEPKVLALTGTLATGLNPGLTGIRDMYNNGYVNIVQSVSYPTPNYSHFRATDIFMSASDQNVVLQDGWLGRYLNMEYPGFPNGFPNATYPDPLGIQYGSSTSLLMLGPASQMGVTISDPNKVVTDNGASGDPIPQPYTPAGEKLAYVRSIASQSDLYSLAIQAAYNKLNNVNLATYPTGNSLADQLKTTARLINGGLQTKIYCCNFGGFDTHSNQTSGGDNDTGTHFNLLKKVGDAIKAFHDDLLLMGKANKVIGMTFSEFGRRIKSNASVGTDHGAAWPMFIFGSPVTGGITNPNPVIPANAGVNDQIAMQTDFRTIYNSILQRWLCQDANSANTILNNVAGFSNINICSDVECTPAKPPQEYTLVRNYPNPVVNYTTVEFKTDGGHTLMQLVGPNGILINTIMEQTFPGPYTGTQRVDMSGLKTGMYYIRFQNGNKSQMKQVMKLR